MAQVLAGDRLPALEEAGDVAGVDDLAAVFTGTGADVDDMVGDGDGVLVVFDDHHRVADVAEVLQRLDELVVVALVQPDRRLVQDVEHSDEPGADLAGEPDPLGLAARQRGGAAVQVEIVQPDVGEELEPGIDLLEHPFGDLHLAGVEVEGADHVGRFADRQAAQLEDVVAGHCDGERVRVESSPLAGVARHLTHVPLRRLATGVGLGLGVPTGDVGDDTFVFRRVAAGAPVAVAELDLDTILVVDPVQHELLLGRAELLPRHVRIDVVLLARRLQQPVEVLGVATGPRGDGALGDRQLSVGDDEFGIDLEGHAEALAGRAVPVGRVEREVAGGQLVEALAV